MGKTLVHIYKTFLDILLSFDCIKVILKYCFKKNIWNLKNKDNPPAARVEPGAFGSVVTCVTNGAIQELNNCEISNIYKKGTQPKIL